MNVVLLCHVYITSSVLNGTTNLRHCVVKFNTFVVCVVCALDGCMSDSCCQLRKVQLNRIIQPLLFVGENGLIFKSV